MMEILVLVVGIVAIIVCAVAVVSMVEAVVYDVRKSERTPFMYKVHVRLVYGYWPKDNKR